MPMDERVKTDVRLPEQMMRYLDEQSRMLGIPKNGYIMMALCRQIVDMGRFVRDKRKRQTLLKDIEDLFQKTIEDARKT